MSITHHVMSVGEAMSIRVQVILDEEENAMFRQQARKESVTLSRWLRESGRKRLEAARLQGSPFGRALMAAFQKSS
jgi:ssDNA-binding replication factor A large subunit